MTIQPMRLDDAEQYLSRVVVALHSMAPERKGPVVAVLEFLLGHIRQTRRDLNALRLNAAREPSFSSTVDELDEIVRETAAATNKIIDATEAIERIGAAAPPQIADPLRTEAVKIYEASAFQDITSQRIAKAMQALQQLERQIDTLAHGYAFDEVAPGSPIPASDADALTNGPQLAGNALSQADIDKLLAGLG
jgi:chemotaxis protein CheZ